MAAIPLSVLDLSILNQGSTSAESLHNTTVLAQRADELGYSRFWVAEHHNMPTIACTSPPVLIAHLAAVTDHIRVGSGGVMLPNHAPLVVGEQFAMLEALHPGRIDLGIGRAPGTDQRTAMALRRTEDLSAEDFPRDLLDLMGLLGDDRTGNGLVQRFGATPAPTTSPSIFLLGSSGYSAQLAGMLGLPFAFAHHFDMGGTLQAAELYLSHFKPSVILDEPHLIVTANALAADTPEDAEYHGSSVRMTMLFRRTGRMSALMSPEDALAHPEYPEARRMPTSRILGDAPSVVAELHTLAERTQANELMITSVAFHLDARVHSLELIAKEWGLGG